MSGEITISAADVNTPTILTQVGDSVNQAIRVNQVAGGGGGGGTSSNVTVTNWTFGGTVSVTGNLNATVNNVSVTNVVSVTQNTTPWTVTFTNPAVTVLGTPISVTYSQGTQLVSASQGTNPWVVTGTGIFPTQGTIPATLSAVASLTAYDQLLVTFTSAQVIQGTNPWTVTFSGSASQVVTFSNGTQVVSALQNTSPWVVSPSATSWVVTQSGGNTWLVSATQGTNPWTVTFTNPAVTILGTPISVTYSQGTQLVSATQGTTPWVVTPSATNWVVTQSGGNTWLVSATQGSNPWSVSLTQVVLSSNTTTLVTPTNPAVAVARSVVECLVPVWQVVSTTAASATIIAGVAGKKIFVTGYTIIAAAPTTITWVDSGATPAGLTGPIPLAPLSGLAPQGSMDSPQFAVVTPGNGLKILQTATASLAGVVTAYQF